MIIRLRVRVLHAILEGVVYISALWRQLKTGLTLKWEETCKIPFSPT